MYNLVIIFGLFCCLFSSLNAMEEGKVEFMVVADEAEEAGDVFRSAEVSNDGPESEILPMEVVQEFYQSDEYFQYLAEPQAENELLILLPFYGVPICCELLCHIAEFMPTSDIKNMALAFSKDWQLFVWVFWKIKIEEDFGVVQNQTIQKSLDSAKRRSLDFPMKSAYLARKKQVLKNNKLMLVRSHRQTNQYRDNISRLFFEDVDLTRCHVSFALRNAKLSRAKFGGASIGGSRFVRCTGKNLDCNQTQMRDCFFSECELQDAALISSILTSCEIEFCSFAKSNFCRSNLQNVRCRDTDFRECIFTNSTLSGAFFERCDFRGADLTAIIHGRHLRPIFTDCNFEDAFQLIANGSNGLIRIVLDRNGREKRRLDSVNLATSFDN